MFSLLAVACSKGDPTPTPDPTPDPEPIAEKDPDFDAWAANVKSRIELMSNISWTPAGQVPKVNAKEFDFYVAGTQVTGIPYSASGTSVEWSIKGYLGRDISFHTFLSAVKNPKSVLYTEDYRKSEADWGVKAPYYGTDLTAAAFFVWGVPATYAMGDIEANKLPFLKKKDSQEIDDLQAADGIFCYVPTTNEGRLLVVADAQHDSDKKLKTISVFESSPAGTKLTEYSRSDFRDFVESFPAAPFYYAIDFKGYKTQLTSTPFAEQSLTDVNMNVPTDLCVHGGDMVSIAAVKGVDIDILSDKYTKIQIYRDNELTKEDELEPGAGTYHFDGGIGMYKARLSSASGNSDYTYFELTDQSVEYEYKNDVLTIKTGTNTSVPQFVSLNDNTQLAHLVTKKSDGVWEYKASGISGKSCRVHFAGKYSTFAGASKKIQ